jgi:RNA polymerase sigma-70 factor (sigma-E family)
VVRARASSEEFEEAFRLLLPRAVSVAFRILGNVSEAEDAAAEALARGLVSWDRVGALPYRDAWVLRVTANVAIDTVRKRQRRLFRRDQRPETESPDPAEGVVLDPGLRNALSALPRRQREVVILRHVVDLSEGEVAQTLGVSPGAVKQHDHRGLAALRQRLGGNWMEMDGERLR